VLAKLIEDIMDKFKEVFNIDPIIKLVDEFIQGKQTAQNISTQITEHLRQEIR
jgi:hypothetical protein